MNNNQTANSVTNYDIVESGIPGGPYIPELRRIANEEATKEAGIAAAWRAYEETFRVRRLPLQDNPPMLHANIEVDTEASNSEAENENIDKSVASMMELARTPTVRELALMPDACPSGPVGSITVGGVAATENAIHPGFHSADVCCSMMATNLGNVDPALVMDAAFSHVRFGPRGRNEEGRLELPASLRREMENNPFMRQEEMLDCARYQLGTQGDGNHFYFVGRSEKTGDTYVISHHGSRGLGGRLYKKGMLIAEKFTRNVSPDTLKGNSWIEADSADGQDYWEALQIARAWTKLNHSMVHDLIARTLGVDIHDRFWNEHNFVFKRRNKHGKELFYHAKGATPAWDGFAADNDPHGRTIIPMNMSQPVLFVNGSDNPNALGFSPHGAGRNFSRTVHKATLNGRSVDEVFHEETAHIDARFQAGKIDTSELPSAYKDADSVIRQIRKFNLAEINDRIMPYGSIMAGEIDAPWKHKRRAKKES